MHSSSQAEIVENFLRNGWDYIKTLVTGGQTGQPDLPTLAVLRNIFVDLGPIHIKLGQLLSTCPGLLPTKYINTLSSLQADVPPISWSEVETLIRQ